MGSAYVPCVPCKNRRVDTVSKGAYRAVSYQTHTIKVLEQFMNNDVLFPINTFSCPLLQILTQEDWNKVLYNGMASTTPVAALYFIALMTFGNYVLFNLLVAILVEGFQTEV